MTFEKITAAVKAADEFKRRAKIVLADRGSYEAGGHTFKHHASPRDTGALRRASMELTRNLADMRKP